MSAGAFSAALAVGLTTALASAPATAADRMASEDAPADVFARVVVDSADLRTGPGVSYRVVYTAHRGETFALDGRPGTGFWLRVLLPDGRAAYALGDEVQPFAVRAGEEGGLSRPGLFAPPPLQGSRAGLALVGGLLSLPVATGSVERFGYVEARPSFVVSKTLSIEGFLGDGLTSNGTQLLYGGGIGIYLAPDFPVCPFVGLFAGGLSVFPTQDSFVLKREDLYLARAGGGLLFALRGRILVRLEATNVSVFSSSTYQNGQTYAGGLGVYF